MRVSGFVMTDESGKVLAVSVGGAADLAKSLAAPKAAPESPAELVEEHKRLVDVLRSPSHADDLEEAKRQEAELAEYRDEADEPMSKAHVKGYTRKDGTFVKEHDDKRQAAQQSSNAGASYDHPNVVGKADFGKESPEKGWSMKFAGTNYFQTGKSGASMHDQTPVREFEAEDGHRVWADGAGRVHADSRDEVPALRKKFEAAAKPAARPKSAASRKAAASPAGDDAPAEGEVGHHEHTTYGVYHRPGSTVKDNHGKTHKVLEHRGAQVLMEDGTWFHPTKIHKQGDKPMAKALMFVGSDASVAELAVLTNVSGK